MKKTVFLTALLVSAFAAGPVLAQSQDNRTVTEQSNTVYTYRNETVQVGAFDRMGNPMPQIPGGPLGEKSGTVQTNDGIEENVNGAIMYDGIVEPALSAGESAEALPYGTTHTTTETVTMGPEGGLGDTPVTSHSVTTTTSTTHN